MRRKRKSPDAGAKPVYLVVEHKVEQPSHSIVVANGTTAPPATIPLRNARRGMSFAVVGSRWIVGVGGDYRSHSTIYDLATSTESGGPWLYRSKLNPVLIPHRDMLYVLSSRPRIDHGTDFEPWFEGFLFRDDLVPRFGGCSSQQLPPPPIFPCCINPLEYLNPPDVRVAAYAVVDSHILLSVSFRQQQEEEEEEKGTCAFDMDRRVLEMVDSKSLPFLGQAIHLGNHLFLAPSKEGDGTAAVYYMSVFPAKDTGTGKAELSILKMPPDLPKGFIVPGQPLCALGMDCFSSFAVRSSADNGPDTVLEKARVIQRTYSLVKEGDTSTNHKVVKWQSQTFKLPDGSYILARPAPLVAAFTVDSEGSKDVAADE